MTEVVTSRAELAAATGVGQEIGFVPTMGALHAGHASLMRAAREAVGSQGLSVVSIFVNPTQFAPHEDLAKYPRTLDADLELCRAADVDVVFAPTVAEVYPLANPTVTVDPGPLGAILEGELRPTHFRGVLTVVAKLFGLVRPTVAIFGEKDYQQLALIRHLAAELCLGVDVRGAATVREPDGLALSSRNRYLDAQQRAQAAGVSAALRAVVAAAASGESASQARAAGLAELANWPGLTLQYLAIRHADLGELPERPEPGVPVRALIAVQNGATRLIDNMALRFADR